MALFSMTTAVFADCPLWTYPENHKLDSEVNNLCQLLQNPTGNILSYSTGTFTYIKTSSEVVNNSLYIGAGKFPGISNYTSGGSANDAILLFSSGTGASFGIKNQSSVGFSGIEFMDSTGTIASFVGFNNNGTDELRINEVLQNGFITLKINSVEQLRVNSNGAKLVGTLTNDNASTGYYGEYISSVTTGVVPASTGVWGNVVKVTLTAGDWDVSGIGAVGGGTFTGALLTLSLFSGNTTTDLAFGDNAGSMAASGTGQDWAAVIPVWRVSIAVSTIVYLKEKLTYTVAPTPYGRISARRVR